MSIAQFDSHCVIFCHDSSANSKQVDVQRDFLYVGTWPRTYRSDREDTAFGIYSFSLDTNASCLGFVSLTETKQPGWVTMHPNGRLLYGVNEVREFDGAEGGGVTAFAVDPETGRLSPLNSHRTTSLPCHCVVDVSGRYLLVACYGGGTVHLFSLLEDGRIGAECDVHHHLGSGLHPTRQSAPHPHSVNFDPANRFVLVPDLGADQIFVYELDRDAGKLLPRPERGVKLAPGSGPRHLAFAPHARFAYVINELSCTVTAYDYDSSLGALHELQTMDLMPIGFKGFRSGAEIVVHPSGRFVYATTRSHDSKGMPKLPGLDLIVWCAIDPQLGTLEKPSAVPPRGGIPRSLKFDSTGDRLYVANQSSNTIVTFRVDQVTGEPLFTGDTISTPVPVCLCLSESRWK
jgi:6-phosphogluconolactonase